MFLAMQSLCYLSEVTETITSAANPTKGDSFTTLEIQEGSGLKQISPLLIGAGHGRGDDQLCEEQQCSQLEACKISSDDASGCIG